MRYSLSHLANSWKALPAQCKAARCLMLGNGVVAVTGVVTGDMTSVASGVGFMGINLLYDRFPQSKGWFAIAATLCIPPILLLGWTEMAAGNWGVIYGTGTMVLAHLFGVANQPLEKHFAQSSSSFLRNILGAPVKTMGTLNAVSKLVLLGSTLHSAAVELLAHGSLANKYTAFLGVLGAWFGADYFMRKSRDPANENTAPRNHFLQGSVVDFWISRGVDIEGSLNGQQTTVRVPFAEYLRQLSERRGLGARFTAEEVRNLIKGKTLILKNIRRLRGAPGTPRYRARIAGSIPPLTPFKSYANAPFML